MKKPMTTSQVRLKFKPPVEDSTCSMVCSNCTGRIWFRGSWSDPTTPKTFECPICVAEQVGPFTAPSPRLDKGDLSILITICEKELEFSSLPRQIVQPTLDKLNTMLKELH